jgi:hypothetical protein
MSYKTFAAGEILRAVDVNTYLMNQTVPNFDNAAQRDAQWPNPSFLARSTLSDSKYATWWFDHLGLVWRSRDERSGKVTVTTNSVGLFTVTFSPAFTIAIPQVVILQGRAGASASTVQVASLVATSTTLSSTQGIVLEARTGALVVSGTTDIHYHAVATT